MTTPSPHRTHGHLLHPWELATLVHNYDRQMELQQNQLTYVRQAQTALRRAAPLSELLNRVGPTVPNYEYLYETRQLLTHMQQRVTEQERVIIDAFLPLPTPFVPDDDYGFLRRPEPHLYQHQCFDAVYILVAAVHQHESNRRHSHVMGINLGTTLRQKILPSFKHIVLQHALLFRQMKS